MKVLKKLFVAFLLFLTFLIGIYIKDDKLYYISFGDGLSLGINENNYISYGYSDFIKDYLIKNNKLKFYTKNFSKQDIRITDMINNINDNEFIDVDNKIIYIQSALNKADLITISVGLNEIMYKFSNNTNTSYLYDYIDSYIDDMNKLIKLIKKYNNKKIFILGYYTPKNDKDLNKYMIYANDKLINICNKEKVNYIDIYNIFKNRSYLIYNLNNYYPNKEGYKLISNEIIKKLIK